MRKDKSINALYGVTLANATEVPAATKIPVLDKDLKINSWINPENLPPNKDLAKAVKDNKERLEFLHKQIVEIQEKL